MMKSLNTEMKKLSFKELSVEEMRGTDGGKKKKDWWERIPGVGWAIDFGKGYKEEMERP